MFSDLNSTLPDSILERSRTSLIRFSRCWLLVSTSSSDCFCSSFISPSAQGASRKIIEHFGIPTNDPTAIPLSFFVDENFSYGKFLDDDYEMHNPMNFELMDELVTFARIMLMNSGKLVRGKLLQLTTIFQTQITIQEKNFSQQVISWLQ